MAFLRPVLEVLHSRLMICKLLGTIRHTPTSTRAITYKSEPTEHAVKPYSSIPGPTGLPVIGSALELMTGEKHSLHKFIHKYYKNYKKVFKINLGTFNVVVLKHPADVQTVWKREGKYPKRLHFEHWAMHREMRGLNKGLILSDDEEWQRNRSALNPHMMRPHNVAQHTERFAEVARDFVNYLDGGVRQKDSGRVADLRSTLFYWSFESACCLILEKRLGSFGSTPSEEVNQFVSAIHTTLRTTDELMTIPAKLAKVLRLPSMTSHLAAWDDVFKYGSILAETKITEIRRDIAAGQEVQGLIATMLSSGTLTDEEVLSTLMDVMLGAVDTTSGSVFWALYLLSKHPDKQQKLYEEVRQLTVEDGVVSQKQVREMSYMKAFLKEVLRLFPVAPIIGRITQEDVVLSGYHIPQSTTIMVPLWSMGQDPEIYTEPEQFRPERWLRGNASSENIHPFANIAFSHGPRACIGRRIAELQTYVLLTEIIKKYELVDGRPGENLDTYTRVVLAPKQQDNIVLRKRIQ